MSDDREQLEKDHALFVRRLLSRFLNQVNDPKARVIVKGFELRENGLTPAKLVDRLGGRWVWEYVDRFDYYVFRRPRPQTVARRPLRIAYREPEGRWLSLTPRAENRP